MAKKAKTAKKTARKTSRKTKKKSAKKHAKKGARRRVAKKTARRTTRKKASRRGAGASLRGVPTTRLRAELERRSRDLDKLEAKREALLARVEAVDGEISSISAALGLAAGRTAGGARRGRRPAAQRAPALRAGGRKRARNAESLEVALAKVLKGRTMGVTEVAEAVQKAGYTTTSPNFRTIVNQTLIKSGLIKKVERGAYTAA